MKLKHLITISSMSVVFLFGQTETWRTSTDIFGNTTSTSNKGSTGKSSTDIFGNTTTTITTPKKTTYWWE